MAYIKRGQEARSYCISKEFNIDNGAAATDDDLVMHFNTPVTLIDAVVVYTEASDSGDASGANLKVGTAQGGVQVVAQTSLENGKAVGSETALTLASTALAAGTDLWVRHTGIAATQTGKYKVAFEYEPDVR